MCEVELFEDGRANGRISVPTEVNLSYHCTNIGTLVNSEQYKDSASFAMVGFTL